MTSAPHHLDILNVARAGEVLEGVDTLARYERLAQECQATQAPRPLAWRAQGELREQPGGAPQVWLHLAAQVSLPLVCQRCMGPVDMDVAVERSFRFVATEAEAEAQDDECEEDVLALSPEFSLRELLEDELLMALPLVPRHDTCPVAVKLAAADPDFEQAMQDTPHPFAALAALKKDGAR